MADEKHSHCLTDKVYLPTIVCGHVLWHLGYTEHASTATAGSLMLMTLPIPYWLEVLLGVYRSSGRFFWPLYYLLMLAAVAMTWHNWKPGIAVALLALALSIQIRDILPLRGAVYVAGHGDLHNSLQILSALLAHHQTAV